MKLVTKNIHYAIKSLLFFAHYPARVITVGELVKKLNLRRAFLRRILQILSRHKVLKSLKGRNGGFILNINPNVYRVIDIVHIFHKETDIIDCLLEKGICLHPKKCLLMREIRIIERQLNNKLKRLTIARLRRSIGISSG